MKAFNYIFVFLLMFSPAILSSQSACEPGSEFETCAPLIPTLTEVITGFKTYSNENLKCYWVCPGDSLRLEGAVQCNIFLEPNSYLFLAGNFNYVWGKTDAKIVLSVDAFNTNVEILQMVNYDDDGMNTSTTICPSLNYNYVHAPINGCDLTNAQSDIEDISVQFYPNPVSGDAVIFMDIQAKLYGEIFLSDGFGRTIKSWVFDGQQNLELPLDGVAPGVYLIHLPKEGFAKKIVVF